MEILRRHGARVLMVSEPDLLEAPRVLREALGPVTTPSGAAGFAGLRRALEEGSGPKLGLDTNSRVLVVVTERDLERE